MSINATTKDIEQFAYAGGTPTLAEWTHFTDEQRGVYLQAQFSRMLENAFWFAAAVRDPQMVRVTAAQVFAGEEAKRTMILEDAANALIQNLKAGRLE